VTASIPVAVAPSVRSPGLYLLINLLAGQSSPGSGRLRGLIMASKIAAGTITADTQVVASVAGPDAVSTYLGSGTLGHLASKALFTENPLAQVDLVAPAAPAGAAAAQTITFAAGPPSVTWTITGEIAGRPIECQWIAGASDIAGAAALAAAINAKSTDLPVTAANGGTAICTVTCKQLGTIGNDVKLSFAAANGATGTITVGGATLTGGTLEMDISNALATVAGTEYDYILICASNTDVIAASATSAPGDAKTHVTLYQTGRGAKLQQVIVGCTSAIASVKTGTGQHNFGPMQYVYCQGGRSLPCEWAAAEMGARMREETIDPDVNRIEMPYRATLYGAKDLNADALTDTECEDLLWYGVSPIVYDTSGNPLPARPITTYHKDGTGAPDDRLLDTSRVTGTYAVAKDLRVAIPREFPNCKLSEDLVPGDDPLPEGVVEVRDIKSFVNSRIRYWIGRGVVIRDKYETALTDGSFIVRVNPTDPSQCDIVLPVGMVPPLAKFSVVVQHVGPN
jgi:phage tail sheath gpL-like